MNAPAAAGCSGQAILELTISAAAVLLTLTGAGWVLHAEWDRGRCAYVVFERTHARLVGQASVAIPADLVTLRDEPGTVAGEGVCGKAQESVRLQKLEAAS